MLYYMIKSFFRELKCKIYQIFDRSSLDLDLLGGSASAWNVASSIADMSNKLGWRRDSQGLLVRIYETDELIPAENAMYFLVMDCALFSLGGGGAMGHDPS